MKPTITVVGLGSGDPEQLTLGVWRRLQQAERRYVRTAQHPMMTLFEEHRLAYRSFDELYERLDSFPDVYAAIADELLRAAGEDASSAVLYAVPGHPMVAERTVQLLRERCPEAGIALEVLGGESFLDQAFLRFGFDPIEGFQLLDATELKASQLRPELHTVIGQVYDAFTASDAKLTLMAGAWHGVAGAPCVLFLGALQQALAAILMRVLGITYEEPESVKAELEQLRARADAGDEDAKSELADDPMAGEARDGAFGMRLPLGPFLALGCIEVLFLRRWLLEHVVGWLMQ